MMSTLLVQQNEGFLATSDWLEELAQPERMNVVGLPIGFPARERCQR